MNVITARVLLGGLAVFACSDAAASPGVHTTHDARAQSNSGVRAVASDGTADTQTKRRTCVSDAEKHALDVRVLQTELMIGALKCKYHSDYNAFVARYKPYLAERSKSLRALFVKQHGPGARSALNSFVTRLANDASKSSNQEWTGYCDFSETLFEQVLAGSPETIRNVTESRWIADRHAFVACAHTEAPRR